MSSEEQGANFRLLPLPRYKRWGGTGPGAEGGQQEAHPDGASGAGGTGPGAEGGQQQGQEQKGQEQQGQEQQGQEVQRRMRVRSAEWLTAEELRSRLGAGPGWDAIATKIMEKSTTRLRYSWLAPSHPSQETQYLVPTHRDLED